MAQRLWKRETLEILRPRKLSTWKLALKRDGQMQIESAKLTPSALAREEGRVCTLDKLCAGQRGQVSTVVRDDIPLYLKLRTMGIVPGSTIEVSRIAPLGDPIAVRTTGHNLSLRLSEARAVEVIPHGAAGAKR